MLALLVSFLGVVVIATKGNLLSFKFENPFGVALAAGSSLIWALYWTLNVKDKRDEIVKLALNFFFGFVFILVAAFSSASAAIPGIKGGLSALYIGCFEMGITFVLWLKAMKYSNQPLMSAI